MGLVWAVIGAELRQLLRDVNTLVFTVCFPLFLFPVVVWGFSQVEAIREGWEERLVPKVVVPDALAAALPDTVERVFDGATADAVVTLEGRQITIGWDAGEPVSELARRRLVDVLDEPWEVVSTDVAPATEALTAAIAASLPGILVVLGVVASLYPAVEVVVADRERGTLETTLVTAAPRWVFMAGKLVSVGALTLLAVLATLVGALVTLFHLAAVTGSEIGLPPIRLLGVLPLAVITSLTGASLALLAAAPMRTFKQAQNTTTGVSMVVLTAAVVGMLPHSELAAPLALVPVTNAVLVMRFALLGEPVGAWAVLAVAQLLIITAVSTGWAARTMARGDRG